MPTPIDPEELDHAWRTVRDASERLDRIAREEGWPVPFTPVRYLILTRLAGATALGLTSRRIARALEVRPSTVAHHLDVLEGAGLVVRVQNALQDGRKVAVRLTDAGKYATRRLGAPPSRLRGPHPPTSADAA